jgi:ATP-dependent HslUV protease ATP-binding subunit HslU
MPILLPSRSEALRGADGLTPREIVAELDRHVIGQAAAKRAVAIALRNRIRRQRLPAETAAEITPKNILMIGPTGVGKTEIARRLARLAGSPFLKVEASKFTEVGYVGRDVDSIIRDLTHVAVDMVRGEKRAEIRAQAEAAVEERLLDLLLPPVRIATPTEEGASGDEATIGKQEQGAATRERLRSQLRAGRLDHRSVEIDVRERGMPSLQVLTSQGVEEMDVNFRDLLPGLFGGQRKKRALPLAEARHALLQEEEERLIDSDQAARQAIERVETGGIVFIDEIDKIAGREAGHGPEVSREGVQRDLLPILEGTTVSTKYGSVKTDHILFVGAGAFHVSRPSDLIPELQGRFPIRVELDPLGLEDLTRILTEPRNALARQYQSLLATEGVDVTFSDDAIREMARFAMQVNETAENIGARRLATVLETVLEETSFTAPEQAGAQIRIDAETVRQRLAPLVGDQDLSRFIL